MTMPLLFLFLRVALVIAALQLRYSLSRMRSLTSPTSVYDWIASAGQVGDLHEPAWEGGGKGGFASYNKLININ